MKNTMYKLVFLNSGKVYELFVRSLNNSQLFGFIEASELVFGEAGRMVLDPTEEKLREEFSGVNSLILPMHTIIRIEEVSERGKCRITESDGTNTITPFPVSTPPR